LGRTGRQREGEGMSTRKRSKAGLTAAEMKAFRALLLQKRAEILGNVLSVEGEALKSERTDLSRCPIHMGDVGSDTFAIENSLSLAQSERELLCKVNEALDRIEGGTYGICLGTGKPIGKSRLTAIPWAGYSVEYAALLEKGIRPRDADDKSDHSQVTGA